MEAISTQGQEPIPIATAKFKNMIRADKLQRLTEQLKAENIINPSQADVMRITKLSPAQSSQYLKALRKQNTAV
jgi:Tol biopolymer transport system component